MKILHTSDWHLGKNFYSKSRKDEHQAFFAWLLEQVKNEDIDAIIVAGDIFDTTAPPSYAREMYNQLVADLQTYACSLIILGGNHDSVAVLNESKPLLQRSNAYVVASTALPLAEQLIKLPNSQGKPGALVCAVPFIRVRDVLQSQADESLAQKNTNLDQAIREYYQQLYQAAVDYRQAHNLAVPIIMTGHLAALGVSLSDSVRDIYIGNLSGFAVDGFPPADYIALGHIHRPQLVGKQEHIRYSGSPIPLEFDELNTTKQVVLVEFAQDQLINLRTLDIPRFHPMAVLSGSLNKIAQQLQELPASQLPIWLQLQVTETGFISDLYQRVAEITAGLNVEVLRLKREQPNQSNTLLQSNNESLEEFTPQQVFAKRLELAALTNTQGEPDTATEQRLTLLHSKLLEELEEQA